MGRHVQSKTLTTGWWGTISLFVNVGAVISNTIELWKAHAKSRKLGINLNSTDSLPIGRPVLLRPFSWIGPIVIAIAVSMAIQQNEDSIDEQWGVGNCVSAVSDRSFVPISCSKGHDGRIVGYAASSDACPMNTDYTAGTSGDLYCIDTDA